MMTILASPAPEEITQSPAHPLYPADQAFLWLPGFPGKDRPYCSYNGACGIPESEEERRFQHEFLRDGKGAFFSPPFPVNQRTFISWHTQVSPPVPYHAIPVRRPLSFKEMEQLARQVAEVTDELSISKGRLLSVLRNENKTYVLLFLSRMNLLAGPTPHRR